MMNYQSKQIIINALLKVISAAPVSYSNNKYNNNYYTYPSIYPNSDVAMQQFNTWVNYANQILDISYNHSGMDSILSTKIAISQISSQNGISYIQRIDLIKRELVNLTQIIFQY